MNIFKNKSVVRLYAFVTACLIIITLLLSGLNVCAAGSPQLLDNEYVNYTGHIFGLSNFANDTYYNGGAINGDTIADLNWQDYDVYIDNSLYPFNVDVGANGSDVQNLNLNDFQYYQMWYYTGINKCVLTLFYFYDGVTPVCVNDKLYGCSSTNNRYLCTHVDLRATVNNDNKTITFDTILSYGKFSCANPYDDSSEPNFYFITNFFTTLSTNLQMWTADTSYYSSVSGGTSFDGDSNKIADDLTIFLSDKSHAKVLNAEYLSGGSGGSSGDATNYMYFNDFNISYSVSGLKDGNVVCYGDLNDYQKQHLDEFALTYSFNFEYYAYNPVVTGYKYNFTKNYTYQQTLSDFYNNGSSKVFTLKDIMQNINTQDIDSEYGNLYQLVSYLSNTGNNENIEYIWSKAKMKTTVFIVSASDSPSDILNNSNLHSNSFSKGYNFLDGKSSTYSDGITNNNNPYQTSETGSISDQNELNNMPNGVSSSNIPSSQGDNGGSGTSVVTGDNNIVINNNPTFNNDGSVSGSGGGSSDGGVASTFYNTFNPFKTLFSSLNGDNSVISDDTAESIGSNRFISVMSSTFSFIPEGMWSALTTFLIASLSILVVAVVIRVLLDLL